MAISLPTSEDWIQRCAADGEFMLAARQWSGGLLLEIGDQTLCLPVLAGEPTAGAEDPGPMTRFSGPVEVWEKVLAPVPERFNNDLMANLMQGQGLERRAEPVAFAQYYPAMARAIELLRPPAVIRASHES